MMNDYDKKNIEDYVANSRKIEDAVSKILSDNHFSPFIGEVATLSGLHRNTFGGSSLNNPPRCWPLTRPLQIGETFFPAGRLVILQDLLRLIKDYRLLKLKRRSKTQIKSLSCVLESEESLKSIVSKMKKQNALLYSQKIDVENQLSDTKRALEQSLFELGSKDKEIAALHSRLSFKFLNKPVFANVNSSQSNEDSPNLPETYSLKHAIILVGLPASGKNTFCLTYFDNVYTQISMDDLKSRTKERKLLDILVGDGNSFIVNNTNASKDERAIYIAITKQHGYKVTCYFFNPDIKVCLARNQQREQLRRVPDICILTIAKRMQRPSKEEGFDEIFCVRSRENGTYEITPFSSQ